MKERFDYDPGRSDFRLSWTGLAFLVLMILLVLSRGHLNNIISHLSTWFTRVDSKEVLFTYDMMAFNIVKTAVFIMIVSLMKTVYEKTSLRVLPVTVSLAAALANTMFFEYRERTDLAVLFIASFFVLFFAFPKYRKPFSVVFGIGGIIIVALVFMEGSLRYEVGASMSTVDLADYSKVAELYTTGPSVIANARMNYAFMKSQVGLRTVLMDIINSCDVFSTIPFLRFIPNLVNVRTSVEIYVSTIGGYAYIIPNHNLVSLYVGDALCWIVEPLFIIVNIKLLGWFERRIYRLNDLMQVYAVYSIVTMVATGVFCNNLQLMLHSFSSLPLWLLIFSYVNSIGNKTKYSGVASNPKPAKVSYE